MKTQPATRPTELIALSAAGLRPYCSFLLLQDTQATMAVRVLTAEQLMAEVRPAGERQLVGTGSWETTYADQPLTWSAAAYRREGAPSWSHGDVPWANVDHELVLVGRWGRFIAVRAEASVLDAIRRCIRKGLLRRYSLIPAHVMEAALVTGDIRTAHMGSRQRRRRTKPDAKVLSGIAVQDSLDPGTDSSYALSAIRADAALLFGEAETIGVTPGRSSVWVRRCADFPEFEQLVTTVLEAVAGAIDEPALGSPIPFLAAEVDCLDGIGGAFEVAATSAILLPDDASDELREAATALERVSFVVSPATKGGTDFRVEAYDDGHLALRATGRMRRQDGETRLSFCDQEAADRLLAPAVWAAMQCKELLAVHYGSGHTWWDGRMYRCELRDARFPNWQWGDFTGVDVRAEKPMRTRADGRPPLYDAALIGTGGDRSLFGWVVGTLAPRGYLTCDDGPGEVADFVHYDGDRLRVIHVKAATNCSPQRRFAVTSLEQVVAPAAKNLTRANVPDILAALRRHPGEVTWCDGARDASGRRDMIEFIDACAEPGLPVDVVIVQPHLTKDAYERALAGGGEASLRVRLTESLLLTTRSSVTGRAGDLYVYGAQAA